MKTRKYAILGLILALAFVLSPVVTHAQTALNDYKEIIQQLGNMLNQLVSQTVSLVKNNPQDPAIDKYLDFLPLVGQQQKTVVENFVQLVKSIRIPPPTTPSITVVSPNGGETLAKGESYRIKWSSNIPDKTLNIILWPAVDAPPCPVGQTCPILVIYGIASQTPNVGYYDWTVGKVFLQQDFVPAGNYYIEVCPSVFDGATRSGCDKSDSYFKIYDNNTGNLPPSISGVSGPTTLEVGKSGTWSVTASDPENGSLSYSVVWGDEGTVASSPSTSVGVNQAATFTHIYSRAGTFTPTFTVTDNSGQSAKTSLSMVVQGVISQVSLIASSPTAAVSLDQTQDFVANVGMTVRLTAKGGNVYVSRSPTTLLKVVTNAIDGSMQVVNADPCSFCGDTSTYFVIPDGTSRQVNLVGKMSNYGGTAGVKEFKVSSIFWDDDTTGLQEFYLDETNSEAVRALRVAIFLGNGGTPPPPAPTIISSYPPNGAIDARDMSGELKFGFYSTQIPSGYIFPVSDFSVNATRTDFPMIVKDIQISGSVLAPAVVPILNRGIIVGERITITHKPSNFSLCLGFLPGDVDQNGWALNADISLLNSWVGTAQGAAQPLYKTDINRDGVFDAADVIRAGELIADPNRVYRLPACPAPLGLTTSQSQLANTLSSLNSLLQTLQRSLAR